MPEKDPITGKFVSSSGLGPVTPPKSDNKKKKGMGPSKEFTQKFLGQKK